MFLFNSFAQPKKTKMKNFTISILFFILLAFQAFSNNGPNNPPKKDQISSNAATEKDVIVGDNDDGSVIDLLIVYTARLSQDMNGSDNVEKWVDEAMSKLNRAMRNSQINLRVDPVYVAQIPYIESSNATDLTNLTQGINGLQIVHRLRDQYHADAVILFTDNNQGGQAQALMSLEGDFLKSRFMVSNNYTSTFIHEFGHILGAQHDDIVNGELEKAIFPYAHGYTGGNYTPNTTVGGYAKGKQGIGKFENFYSNPDLVYRNAPMGDRATGDNRRTFNETAPYIAKNRSSVYTWTGAVGTEWKNSGNWSANRVPRNIDDVVIPEGLSDYPNIKDGIKAYARNVFISKGASLNMSGGTLNVRGHFKADGNFIATGGMVDMRCNLDKGTSITLSNSSNFHDLKIGGNNSKSWVQLKSSLLVKGGLTIEPWAILDHNKNAIAVLGDWTDTYGGGFDYNASSVKIDGKTTINENTFNFKFPIDDEGFYSSAAPAWSSLPEKGNANLKWMFGGREGMARLFTQQYSQDKQAYMSNVDVYAFTNEIALTAGTSYEFEFEFKMTQGTPQEISVYFGDGHLPSLMTKVGEAEEVPDNNTWTTISRTIKVPKDGIYNLAIRAYNSHEEDVSESFLRNVKITPPAPDATNDFGNGNVNIATTEPTSSEPTDTNTPTVHVPTTTTGSTNTTAPTSTTTTTDPTTTTNPTTPTSSPEEIATGRVYHVSMRPNWRDEIYNVSNDRLDVSAYTPAKDDGEFLAGGRYEIFMLTHKETRSQAFLHWAAVSEEWEQDIKSLFGFHITPMEPGPNTFKLNDKFRLMYHNGTYTWEVWRDTEFVARFFVTTEVDESAGTVTGTSTGRGTNTTGTSPSGTSTSTSLDKETTLKLGEELKVNEKKYSINGKYYLIMQSDGNVVIYTDTDNPIWSTATNGSGDKARFAMQTDGHLVLYDYWGQAIWASQTHPAWDSKYNSSTWKPVKAVLENDGSLVLYSSTGEQVWTSKLGKL